MRVENLFSSQHTDNRTVIKEKTETSNLEKDKLFKKINYYHPSDTWFTPTVVYDQIDSKKLTKDQFGLRNNSMSKSSKLNTQERDIKIDNKRLESKLIENRQQYRPSSNNLLPIIAYNNDTKPNLLKTKEKGIKIITEFELVHKGMC